MGNCIWCEHSNKQNYIKNPDSEKTYKTVNKVILFTKEKSDEKEEYNCKYHECSFTH